MTIKFMVLCGLGLGAAVVVACVIGLVVYLASRRDN
jgi:hypothetical protein